MSETPSMTGSQAASLPASSTRGSLDTTPLASDSLEASAQLHEAIRAHQKLPAIPDAVDSGDLSESSSSDPDISHGAPDAADWSPTAPVQNSAHERTSWTEDREGQAAPEAAAASSGHNAIANVNPFAAAEVRAGDVQCEQASAAYLEAKDTYAKFLQMMCLPCWHADLILSIMAGRLVPMHGFSYPCVNGPFVRAHSCLLRRTLNLVYSSTSSALGWKLIYCTARKCRVKTM